MTNSAELEKSLEAVRREIIGHVARSAVNLVRSLQVFLPADEDYQSKLNHLRVELGMIVTRYGPEQREAGKGTIAARPGGRLP